MSTGDYRFVLRDFGRRQAGMDRLRAVSTWPAGESASFEVDCRLMTTSQQRRRAGFGGIAAAGRNACDWAPAGYELAFGQCVVAGAKTTADAVARPASSGRRHYHPLAAGMPGVRGQGRERCSPEHREGMVSYTFGEREFVLRRPSITTFRPLTDNDRGAGHAFERAAWAVAGIYALRRLRDRKSWRKCREATYTYELAIPQRTRK